MNHSSTRRPVGQDPAPPFGESPRQSLQRKIPYYLLGLAIGCVLVGFMVLARQSAINSGPQQDNPAATARP
ncbi:MAG: hypothetical protein ACK4WH_00030 [Phycisphaerales bacterium]